MHIEIDFEVFKALTALRESESDSYNAVIRRLLTLNTPSAEFVAATDKRLKALGEAIRDSKPRSPTSDEIQQYGVWYGDVFLPEGTRFRATYKGQTHFGRIANGQWVDSEGVIRSSPSDAAGAISNTNVNGWRFWHVLLPGDAAWRKLEELKK